MSPSRLQKRIGKIDAKIGIEYEFVYEEKNLEDLLKNNSPKTFDDLYNTFLDIGELKQSMFSVFNKTYSGSRNSDYMIDQWVKIIDTDITPLLKKLGLSNYYDIKEKYNLETKNYILLKNLQTKFDNFVKPQNAYEFKIDASIKDSDFSVLPTNKLGAEVVSPPQSFEQTIEDLEKIRQFILNNGHTNDTTGLHINVSIPNFDRNNLDYIKLVLLTGDRYVLTQFNRQFNLFAKSSVGKIGQNIKSGQTDISYVLDSFKKNLNQSASKLTYIDGNDKNISINMQPDRIEFRSPGGEWAETITPVFMKQTVMRFVVALDAASDPTKYQREYTKKLYKLFSEKFSDDKNNVSKLFANYFSGSITRKQLQLTLIRIKQDRKKFNDFLDSLDLDELESPPNEIRI